MLVRSEQRKATTHEARNTPRPRMTQNRDFRTVAGPLWQRQWTASG